MAGLGRPLNVWACAALCWGLGFASPAPLLAQFRAQFPTAEPLTPEEILRQRLPHEPQVLSELEEVQALLSNGDYEGAMDILQPLLEQEEDFFDLPMRQSSNRWGTSGTTGPNTLFSQAASPVSGGVNSLPSNSIGEVLANGLSSRTYSTA